MTDQERNEKMSEVSKLEYEMTKAIIGEERHRPHEGDKFQKYRSRVLQLRVELFPDSVWAKGIKKD